LSRCITKYCVSEERYGELDGERVEREGKGREEKGQKKERKEEGGMLSPMF